MEDVMTPDEMVDVELEDLECAADQAEADGDEGLMRTCRIARGALELGRNTVTGQDWALWLRSRAADLQLEGHLNGRSDVVQRSEKYAGVLRETCEVLEEWLRHQGVLPARRPKKFSEVKIGPAAVSRPMDPVTGVRYADSEASR